MGQNQGILSDNPIFPFTPRSGFTMFDGFKAITSTIGMGVGITRFTINPIEPVFSKTHFLANY